MDFQDSVQEAEYKLQVKADFKWKDKQLECLQAVFNGKDILAVLLTGYGKSMVHCSVHCESFKKSQNNKKQQRKT